jgi:hypothetical protein
VAKLPTQEVRNMFGVAARILCCCVIASGTLVYAICPTDMVIVKGRVADAPPNATVRVQLVYSNKRGGDSGDVRLEKAVFVLQVPFFTQSRAPKLIGTFLEKCDRKPKTVIVTLTDGKQEYDHVSLDFVRDFKMADPSAYSLRSEIVLHGPR